MCGRNSTKLHSSTFAISIIIARLHRPLISHRDSRYLLLLTVYPGSQRQFRFRAKRLLKVRWDTPMETRIFCLVVPLTAQEEYAEPKSALDPRATESRLLEIADINLGFQVRSRGSPHLLGHEEMEDQWPHQAGSDPTVVTENCATTWKCDICQETGQNNPTHIIAISGCGVGTAMMAFLVLRTSHSWRYTIRRET